MPRLPKQLIWSVLLWLIVCTSVWSEDDLTITVVPEVPTTNNSVNIVVTDLDRLDGAQYTILSQYYFDGNIVKINININAFGLPVDPLPPPITSINANLGLLSAGSYEIELYLIVIDEIINTPKLIQKSSFSVSSNTNSIPSLSDIGAILLSLTIAIFGGRHRLQQKYSKFTSI